MDKAGSFYLVDKAGGRKARGSAGSQSHHYDAFANDYTGHLGDELGQVLLHPCRIPAWLADGMSGPGGCAHIGCSNRTLAEIMPFLI